MVTASRVGLAGFDGNRTDDATIYWPGDAHREAVSLIERTIHVLAVPDLEGSGAFYREVLGFQVHEIGDPGWRLFVRDCCRIMAGHCPDAIAPAELGDHSYFAYLVVDDVDAFHESVVSRGAEVIKPLRDEPWGMREFGLRTVDGHRVMVGQDVAQ